MPEEYFDLVDDSDQVIGRAKRSDCHGNPDLTHRAVHVLVFNRQGELLLQKRSARKDIQPGKWDTSVGGHLNPGEGYRAAAKREMFEELGCRDLPLTELYASKIRNRLESENIMTYLCVCDGPFNYCRDEIEAIRFWAAEQIDAELGNGLFTPNFEEEWQAFAGWLRRYQASAGGQAFCAGDSFPDIFQDLITEE